MSVEQKLSFAPAATDDDFGKCWLIGEGVGGLWANKSGHIALWGWQLAICRAGRGHAAVGQVVWLLLPVCCKPMECRCCDTRADGRNSC